MRWQCLQHVPFEGPAHLESWASSRGHVLERTELWTGAAFPALDQLDGLFVLGGPMNVYQEDRYPWLAAEKAFLAGAVAARKPIVGICLGAQLLAVVLRGTVEASPRQEIGWFPVDLTKEGREAALFRSFPSRFAAFHWHADRFSIPRGAVHVARTDACPEQAFVYGDRLVGLQFHLESTAESIAALVEHCGKDITGGSCVQEQSAIEQLAANLPAAQLLLDSLLDALVAGL